MSERASELDSNNADYSRQAGQGRGVQEHRQRVLQRGELQQSQSQLREMVQCQHQCHTRYMTLHTCTIIYCVIYTPQSTASLLHYYMNTLTLLHSLDFTLSFLLADFICLHFSSLHFTSLPLPHTPHHLLANGVPVSCMHPVWRIAQDCLAAQGIRRDTKVFRQ